jgi:hypothetical protein
MMTYAKNVIGTYPEQKQHLENLSVWQIPVFRFGLLMRNRRYMSLKRWKNSVSHISGKL